jgi:hypothetical protein
MSVEQICAEIVQTEATYVDDITRMIEVYVKPVRGMARMGVGITMDDMQGILSNVEDLMTCNKALLEVCRRLLAHLPLPRR